MTITTTHELFTAYPSTSPEVASDKKTVAIPPLQINQKKQSPYTATINLDSQQSETHILTRMLDNHQYVDIIEYVETFPPKQQLHWYSENSGYHVPLMFAYALALLRYDDDSDVEDIACTIHFAELRIKQDLACYGYSEKQREVVVDKILSKQIDKMQEVLTIISDKPISKAYILHELNQYRTVLPEALRDFHTLACPPPQDWRIYYQVKIAITRLEKVKNTWISIRHEVFESFLFTSSIIKQKRFFSIEQLTPRHDECIKESYDYLRISFDHSNMMQSNILGLIFNRRNIRLDEIDNIVVTQQNLLIATLLKIWSEKNIKLKNEWITRNAYGQHPLLLYELALSIFELNPTFAGFREAYEYILLGTIRVSLDAECTSDLILQDVPLILKSKYIGQLFYLAGKKCTRLDLTKIYWWEQFATDKTFSLNIIEKFLKSYKDNKVNPDPEWLFTHSDSYDPSKLYCYEELNEFAFPRWMWKKRRMALINSLRALLEISSSIKQFEASLK